MFRANRRQLKLEALLMFSIGTIFLAKAMKNEPNRYVARVAEAGRIETPPLRERETTGIHLYMDFTQKHNFVGLHCKNF